MNKNIESRPTKTGQGMEGAGAIRQEAIAAQEVTEATEQVGEAAQRRAELKEREQKVSEKKSLLETLNSLESDEEQKEFLMRLAGRRVYHFITKEENGERKQVKQYLRLKSKKGQILTFETFVVEDENGVEISKKTGEVKRAIKDVKYRDWKREEPSEEELKKPIFLRNNQGQLNPCETEKTTEEDLTKYYFKDKEGNVEVLSSGEIVKYDKDGEFAYARRTPPRPEESSRLREVKTSQPPQELGSTERGRRERSEETKKREELREEYLSLMTECMLLCNKSIKEFKENNNGEAQSYFANLLYKLKDQMSDVKEKIDQVMVEQLEKDIEIRRRKLENYKKKAEEFRNREKERQKAGRTKTKGERPEAITEKESVEEERAIVKGKKGWLRREPETDKAQIKDYWEIVKNAVRTIKKEIQETAKDFKELGIKEALKKHPGITMGVGATLTFGPLGLAVLSGGGAGIVGAGLVAGVPLMGRAVYDWWKKSKKEERIEAEEEPSQTQS